MRNLEEPIFRERFFGHEAPRAGLARQFAASAAAVSRAVMANAELL